MTNYFRTPPVSFSAPSTHSAPDLVALVEAGQEQSPLCILTAVLSHTVS